MDFEWDADKSDWNLCERGYGFDFAALIFEGSPIEWQDTRKDYGETRIVAIGEVGEVFLTVVYTDRGDVRRIIASWPSSDKEREKWRLSKNP